MKKPLKDTAIVPWLFKEIVRQKTLWIPYFILLFCCSAIFSALLCSGFS